MICLLSLVASTYGDDPHLRSPDSLAATPADMKPYRQQLKDSDVVFDMVPIPGGDFVMGSPATERHREADEGPQHRVKIEPFWMGKCEVTWNEFDLYRLRRDKKRREAEGREPDPVDMKADGVTRPTTEYMDMAFGMGHDGFPVVNMTQLGAKMYCAWLTEKTGQYYRLPTEAEWEYACRAGTQTAYSFGDDTKHIDDYAWYWKDDDGNYQTYYKVGKKKPNPWGLHDMHGNVSEWCLDQYQADYYQQFPEGTITKSPLNVPNRLFPRIFRGGSWYDDLEELRSANRIFSNIDLKIQDAQVPQSMWYLTEGDMIGFRVVRPFRRPNNKEIQKLILYPDIPEELRKFR